MKVRSRILNVFLAIILVFTTVLSTNREVFATKTPDVIKTQNGEGEGIKEDKDGNYKLTKKIEKLGERKATITIGAEGGSVKSTESTKNKIDIVFLADTSGSMSFGLDGNKDNVPIKNQRITQLKQDLKESFKSVQDLVGKDDEVRVGLVSFAKDSYIKYNLTKVDKENYQQNAWNSAVNSLVANGGTYTDKALDDANRMFNDNSAKKILILMTDGHPTYSTEIKKYGNSEFGTEIKGDGEHFELSSTVVKGRHITSGEYIKGYFKNCTVPTYYKERTWKFYYRKPVESHTVGEKWEYIEGWFKDCHLPEYKRPEKNVKEEYFTDDDDKHNVKDNGEAGILRAEILKGKDKNVTIYTMGIGANKEQLEQYLTKVASPDKFYKDASGKMSNFSNDLKNILYKEITTPTISEETLSDTMGDKIKLISGRDDIIKTIDVKAMPHERKKEIK